MWGKIMIALGAVLAVIKGVKMIKRSGAVERDQEQRNETYQAQTKAEVIKRETHSAQPGEVKSAMKEEGFVMEDPRGKDN